MNDDGLVSIIAPSAPDILICVQVFSPVLHATTLTMNFYIPIIAIIVLYPYSFILLELWKVSKRKSILKGRKNVGRVDKNSTATGGRDIDSSKSAASYNNKP